MPYDADPDRITALLEKAYQVTRRTPICGRKILSPIEVRGITEVNDYAFVVQARIKTAPGEQDMIRRAFNRILKNLFDEAGIRIPSPPTSVARPELSPSLTNTKMP